MKISQQTVIGFLIGIFIGGFGMYFGANVGSDISPETDDVVSTKDSVSTTKTDILTLPTTDTTEPTDTSGYSVVAYDQPAGTYVEIIAHLPTDSWVAVHDDMNGKLGNVLGAGWFRSGVASGKIPLIRSTLPDTKYHVVLYTDNGNNTFDYHIDPMLTDSNNAPVMATFTTAPGGASR